MKGLSKMRVVLLCVLCVFVVGCSRRNEPAAKAATSDVVSVKAMEARAESIARRVELVGTLEGDQEVTVSSEVAARVAAIRADLGDQVQAGQVVIELDPTQYRLAVDRQQGALAEALARLGLTRENDPFPAPERSAVVRKATAERQDAKANFDRAQNLEKEGVLSKQLYDSAEARFRASEADYSSALNTVRNYEAQVTNLRAQLAIARKNLADTSIRAPFSGTVRQRLVEVGQYVREQTPVFSLAVVNPLKLRAQVPERWFPHVKPGTAMEVRVEAYPAEVFPGRVTRVAQAVDPQSRAFAVEAQVMNPGVRLRPGLFANVSLLTSRNDAIIRVPASAVISFYGVQKVYRIENGQIKEQVVKLGDRFGDTMEITDGLASGAVIAISELSRIRQGSRVQPQMVVAAVPKAAVAPAAPATPDCAKPTAAAPETAGCAVPADPPLVPSRSSAASAFGKDK